MDSWQYYLVITNNYVHNSGIIKENGHYKGTVEINFSDIVVMMDSQHFNCPVEWYGKLMIVEITNKEL